MRVSPSMVAEMRCMIADGLPCKTVAGRLGVSEKAVRLHTPGAVAARISAKRAAMTRLWAQGLKCWEIGEALGTSKEYAAVMARRLNLPRRRPIKEPA
jgi:DNA-binding CsgD family transcriptional regulator